ncbi:MAG: cytochrome P450 [Proteobacteria bacterium]|nr:cytochrome P450 [Pseudomonadota bacterium]
MRRPGNNMPQKQDWNPRSDESLNQAIATYDRMRAKCPVAYSDYLQWSVFRHADIAAIAKNHSTFSNQVSRHMAVPNGMDPPIHDVYRELINPYFNDRSIHTFEPTCQKIAKRYAQAMSNSKKIDFMAEFAWPVAVAMQCAFLGWSKSHIATFSTWVKRNQQATLAQDRTELAACATEFEVIVSGIIERHRNKDDVTARLLQERVNGELLTQSQLISILRNWAVGEIGTMAAAMGILVQFLTEHTDIQQQLRDAPEKIPEAIEEILRLHGPLVTNRRKTTCPVKLGGRDIPAGAILTVNWVSANRDESVFDQADEFRWGRDQGENLMYGTGIHYCPGAGLARMELKAVLLALLDANSNIESAGQTTPAHYPGSGYATLPIRIAR